jgi:hypothetical protein
MESGGEACSVRVIIRFRPMSEREKKEKVADADFGLNFTGQGAVDVKGKTGGSFSFDRVFDPSTRQITVFECALLVFRSGVRSLLGLSRSCDVGRQQNLPLKMCCKDTTALSSPTVKQEPERHSRCILFFWKGGGRKV